MTAAAAEQQIGRGKQWIVAGLTVAVAATRFLAVSRSMWANGEASFALALHGGSAQHPFPASPLYVFLGRLLHGIAIHDDFRALRTLSLVASMFVFPVAFALGRSMRLAFPVAVSGAVVLAFLPNIWAFGGTAFSDVFSLVLVMGGAALLFASRPSSGFSRRGGILFVCGSALFALAVLAQPANALCAWPWLAAAGSRVRSRRLAELAAATAIALVIVVIGYAVAAGRGYLDSARDYQQRIVSIDGFGNPDRPASLELFPRFVVNPSDAGKAAIVLFIFTLVGVLFAERPEVDALATFLPLLIFVLFTCDPNEAARLSIAYAPLTAFLAVSGIDRFAARAALLLRQPKSAAALRFVLVAALAARFATWFAPALREVRRSDSPPVRAMRWVRDNVPRSAHLLVDRPYASLAAYYLPAYERQTVDGEAAVRQLPPIRNSWHIGDGESRDPVAAHFARDRAKLFAVFGRRGFDSFVRPFTRAIRYGDGWYPSESDGNSSWRWMGRRATLELEPIAAGGELRLTAVFPLDHESPPLVTVSIDGIPREQFTPAAMTIDRAYAIDASPAPHTVTIEVANAVNPRNQHFGDDSRDLGMQLRTIWWQP